MGQAKRRGSFEQRKAESIAKSEENRIRKARERIAIESAKTPEERQAEKAVEFAYTKLFGVFASLMQSENKSIWK